MKVIVGLGNPGRKYLQSRHNIGFMVVSRVAQMIGAGQPKVRFAGEAVEGTTGSGVKLLILWPHTYMNNSGQSVRKAFDFYKLAAEDVLVVCDDLNLPTGKIRMRAHGSAGGQKGVADIIRHLGTEAVPRLRVGIARPPEHWTVTDYVLGKFSDEETDTISKAIDQAAQAALDWSIEGIAATMNRYNAESTDEQKAVAKKSGTRADAQTPKPNIVSAEAASPRPSAQQTTPKENE